MGGALHGSSAARPTLDALREPLDPGVGVRGERVLRLHRRAGIVPVPLPHSSRPQGGLGYQWNDYRDGGEEIGVPREDRILGWYVGLRRPVRRASRPERRLPQRGASLEHRRLRHRRRRLHPASSSGTSSAHPAMTRALRSRPDPALRAALGAGRGRRREPYRVGPGDVLEVAVDGRPDLSRLPTVQTTGGVFLPRAGDVEVDGPDHRARSRHASRRSSSAEDLPAPEVSVRVKEYNSQFVWVHGAVLRPGRKPLRGGTRLVDALLDAGGFTARRLGRGHDPENQRGSPRRPALRRGPLRRSQPDARGAPASSACPW